MRTVDLISKKRNGEALSFEELEYLITGYTKGQIPDYQMSAWMMAVYFKKLNERETADLTLLMAQSGDQADLSAIPGIKVDKHSTGGVGDKTTLVLAPLVAAAGVPVAKMSGKGLGHTGGTIDKLLAIPGYSIDLEREAFIEQVNRHGIAVISQSGNMTPADKMMYSLRDVTATIESVPLIASSIMSKKIAAGADAIVLDVKTGSGAFMKSAEDSIALAQAMVSIGTKLNLQTTALITSMEQPLGYAVGNALEVKEAIAALKGDGPKDLTELCLSLGAYMLIMGQKADDYEEAREKLQQILDKGYALKKFKEWIAAQGGSPSIVDQPELLPNSAHMITVLAAEEGYVQHIHSEQIGHTAMMIGAGRETKAAKIDLTAGVMLRKKIGDHVRPGEILAELHTGMDLRRLSQAAELAFSSFVIGKERKAPEPLLYAIVTEQGVKRLQ